MTGSELTFGQRTHPTSLQMEVVSMSFHLLQNDSSVFGFLYWILEVVFGLCVREGRRVMWAVFTTAIMNEDVFNFKHVAL